MKFNHDAEKIQDVFVDHDLDEKKLQDFWEKFEKDPTSVIGGKKSETAEFLRSIADDPEKLLVTAMVLVKGLSASRIMDQMQDKSLDMLKTMDTSDMPEEIRKQILAHPECPEDIKEKLIAEAKGTAVKPQTVETDDEFEQLKRKYS